MREGSSHHRREPHGITAASVLMWICLIGFAVFAAATRWGLDIFGPWLARTFG